MPGIAQRCWCWEIQGVHWCPKGFGHLQNGSASARPCGPRIRHADAVPESEDGFGPSSTFARMSGTRNLDTLQLVRRIWIGDPTGSVICGNKHLSSQVMLLGNSGKGSFRSDIETPPTPRSTDDEEEDDEDDDEDQEGKDEVQEEPHGGSWVGRGMG
eukprot:Skav219521  [mRNA]  locus=scaffold30:173645:174719:+ [translate_table: standard]